MYKITDIDEVERNTIYVVYGTICVGWDNKNQPFYEDVMVPVTYDGNYGIENEDVRCESDEELIRHDEFAHGAVIAVWGFLFGRDEKKP